MCILTRDGYSAGHPWYYVLGGPVPTVRAIRACVMVSDYRGYLSDRIQECDHKQEPHRTQALESLRSDVLSTLRKDLSRYRACARALRQNRSEIPDDHAPVCADIHTAISLKFNHIYNDFANLRTLDSLPRQASLFDLL